VAPLFGFCDASALLRELYEVLVWTVVVCCWVGTWWRRFFDVVVAGLIVSSCRGDQWTICPARISLADDHRARSVRPSNCLSSNHCKIRFSNNFSRARIFGWLLVTCIFSFQFRSAFYPRCC